MKKPIGIKRSNYAKRRSILGRLLKFLLAPVGITVLTDVKVMSKPPEADILLLKLKSPKWTKEQRERLPDGIRDSTAHHILRLIF